MSFLTPLALIALALAIPIVLMYMLRLRRREVVVSSTFLWRQILRDQEANTPWQRLRRNLLLFLQLLILLLLALALARPYITVPAVSSGRIALLIDASLSMNASDSADGSRLAEAQRRAREIVDTISDADTITIIRVGAAAEVMSPYSADRVQLNAAIAAIQPGYGGADWNAALTLAAAGAQGAEDFSVVLISDGADFAPGSTTAPNLPAIPGSLNYVRVGESSENLAVTALATRALPGEPPQLFGQITNYGPRDSEAIFSLRVDGELFAAERVTVPAGGDLPFVSSALPAAFTTLQADISAPAGVQWIDYLAEDNAAFAVQSGRGPRRILLMSQGNRFLEQVLRALPNTAAFQANPGGGLPRDSFDLYVFDGWLPGVLPDADMLIFDPPESSALFSVGRTITLEDGADLFANPRARRDDPRMAFIDVSGLNVAAFREVRAPWAVPLIENDGGPLLLAGETGGRQIAIVTFDLRQSDLPLQIAFPVLMASLLDWFTPQQIVSAPEGLRVGETIAVTPPAEATAVRIILPDGTTRSLPIDRRTLSFTETMLPGIYRAEALAGEDVIESAAFAVNPLTTESGIQPQVTIQLGSAVIEGMQEEEVGQREFWSWLAAAALIVLLIEWYAYHRRLRAPTLFRPLTRLAQQKGAV